MDVLLFGLRKDASAQHAPASPWPMLLSERFPTRGAGVRMRGSPNYSQASAQCGRDISRRDPATLGVRRRQVQGIGRTSRATAHQNDSISSGNSSTWMPK